VQAALEAEITEFLGRGRYQRGAACEDARPGSRNGYREVTVKTTAGPVTLARPKLRGTTEAFASRLFGSHVTKTNALESLVIASFVRGLSVRDVEATLAGAPGDQAAISKSTVSAICGQLKDEYQAWTSRRLDDITLDYLFLDASFFRMHPGSPAEPVLAAWGITTGGKPAFIGLAPGAGQRRVRRRLARLPHRPQGPRPALPAAGHLRRGTPADQRDRAGLPPGAASALPEPGPRLVELVGHRITEMAGRYAATYPAAMKCLLADRGELTAYLRFPAGHHHRIRHPDFIERTFGGTRRRTKVIGRLPDETSCLTLVWAMLDRASRGWRGLTMTSNGLRLLQDLRRSLPGPPRQLRPRTVTAARDDERTGNVSATA
jgi:transposase-like protein